MSTGTIALIAAFIALISATAAWTAVLVQRRNATDTINAQVNIGARNSRAAVVSANRQKWIDALRDDISEFVANRVQLAGLANAGSFLTSGQDALVREERTLRTTLLMLRVRVELRLNRQEVEHLALLDALDRYDAECSPEADCDLRRLATEIFKFEWERLKKEAAGIDPFVKEIRAAGNSRDAEFRGRNAKPGPSEPTGSPLSRG